ncbi:MAG TPA: hypothetical protein VG713_06380 [Pirellulales bacterium]|nr:hypothetical protein [Pirellulales bacterium]
MTIEPLKNQIQLVAESAPEELYLTYIAGYFPDDGMVRLIRDEDNELVLVIGHPAEEETTARR